MGHVRPGRTARRKRQETAHEYLTYTAKCRRETVKEGVPAAWVQPDLARIERELRNIERNMAAAI